jgi:hypothetical protein
MWALGVIAGLLLIGALARHFLQRDNVPPMERHLRALETLRDLAEHPHPAVVDVAPVPEISTEHVRILESAPAGAKPTRRATAKRPAARAGARRSTKSRVGATRPEVERPTIVIRPAAERTRPEPVAFPVAPLSPAPVVAGSVVPEPVVPEPVVPEPVVAQALVPEPLAPEPLAPEPLAPEPLAADPVVTARGPRLSRERLTSIPAPVRTGAAAIATVVVAMGVLVAAGSSGHGASHAPARVTREAAPASRVISTPTTSPRKPVVTPVAARLTRTTAGGGMVSVHTPFQLTLHATGTCWIQITDTAGRRLFTTTLHPGQEQKIPGAESIVVRLGYTPAITISVDGATLDLSGLSQTANLNFQTA